jgi:MinD-like ATPase involved in chromosome partitioning or flagellar assembly
MPIVAVAGDRSTTTALALAAAWPGDEQAVVFEADPTGGDLAAWLDLEISPSLSSVVAHVRQGAWLDIERFIRCADCGIRLIPAPTMAVEARQAVAESVHSLVPTLAALDHSVIVADTGRLSVAPSTNPFVAQAHVTVLVHHQAGQSSRAAAVRLTRLVEQIEALASSPTIVVVAIVGGAPFELSEVDEFLTGSVGEISVVGLPTDDLAAAVFGGRTGVSPRRFERLPLIRAAHGLVRSVEAALTVVPAQPWSVSS